MKPRYTTHGRSLGRSMSWCGLSALHNAPRPITTATDPHDVDCGNCRRSCLARGELTQALRLPEPRVRSAAKRGAA